MIISTAKELKVSGNDNDYDDEDVVQDYLNSMRMMKRRKWRMVMITLTMVAGFKQTLPIDNHDDENGELMVGIIAY